MPSSKARVPPRSRRQPQTDTVRGQRLSQVGARSSSDLFLARSRRSSALSRWTVRVAVVAADGGGHGYGRSMDRYDPLDRLVYGAMDDNEMDTILDALERASAEDETPSR